MAASPRFLRSAPKVVPKLDRGIHRLSGGRLMMSRLMLPCVVLTTTGRKSGQQRTTPLATVPYQGDLYVVGSNYAKPQHPAWSWNLIAHPDASASFEGEEFAVRATLLDDDEKASVWPALIAEWPLFDTYTARSGRDLRVFRLSRA